MPELRKDPLRARWVVVVTERVAPFDAYRHPPAPPGAGPCRLCPGYEHETPPELLAYRDAPGATANGPGWRVRVMPARFPALRPEGAVVRRGQGLYDLIDGVGVHETIVEAPGHGQHPALLSVDDTENVLRAYRDRLVELRADDRLRAALILRRHRGGPGFTREHPHSELLAAPVVPSELAREVEQARVYYEYRERCLLCDVVRQEVDSGARIVLGGEHVVALTPFASSAPFEVWILPRRHNAAFESSWATEHRDTARVLREVLARLDRLLGDPPFTMRLHSAPFGDGESPSFHWHLEIVPTPVHADLVREQEFLVENPLPPEDAARALRDAAP